jgi:hypothetical protein
MDHASTINFLSNEDTQELAPGFFILYAANCVAKKNGNPFTDLEPPQLDTGEHRHFPGPHPPFRLPACVGPVIRKSGLIPRGLPRLK